MRIAIGPKDLQNGTVEIARRDTLTKEVVSQDEIVDYISSSWRKFKLIYLRKPKPSGLRILLKLMTFETFQEVLKEKVDLFLRIGTEQMNLKKQLKKLQKQPFDVFLWIMLKKQVFVLFWKTIKSKSSFCKSLLI